MALGKRLINTGAAAAACSTDSVQAFGADSAFSSNVALYQLDSDGGTTNNVPDTTGNYNGTASNVTYASGHIGNAAVFNGSSSKIDLPNFMPSGNADRSISMWIKTTTTAYSSLFRYGTGTPDRYFLFRVNTGNKLGVAFYANDYDVDVSSTGLFDGNWHHVAMTYDGTTIRLYVDGAEQGSGYNAGPTNTDSSVGRLGYQANPNGSSAESYFDGSIDQVRIFDKAISAEDVATLYAETTSTASNTNPFSEGAGVALYTMDYDASEASGYYDGTPTNVEFGVGGKINYGARFNGSSSKIQLPTSTFSPSTFSLSAWCNVTSDTDENTIIELVDNQTYPNNTTIVFSAGSTASSSRFLLRNYTTNQYDYSPSGTVSKNVWKHYAMTYDGSTVKSYIDGSLVDSGSLTLSNTVGTISSIQIGLSSGSRHLNGDIDQVRIFSKALSPDEVDELWNSGNGEIPCVYTCTTDTVDYPTTNLAYYKLDNSAEDETGSYDGTESNIEYRFGRYGQAAVFNGSSSKILPSSSPIPSSGAFTVSAWVKTSVSNHCFISFGDFWLKAEYLSGVFSLGDLNTSFQGTTDISDGNWHHCVLTVDNSNNIALYVDGTSEDTGTSTISRTNGGSFVIGVARNSSPVYYFNGSIDQVRIYSTALTSSQVTELYEEKPCADTSNFKAVLYEGNGGTQYISNVGFDLDVDNGGDGGLVWVKNRDFAVNHYLYDSIRGTGAAKALHSNTTNSETSASTYSVNGGVESFDANGFFAFKGSDGTYQGTNKSGQDYVAWVWKSGGEAVNIGVNSITGSTPSIASDVSANTAAGFSIVKYTTQASGTGTVGHGLDYPPEIVIVKTTGVSDSWRMYHSSLGADYQIYLNLVNSAGPTANQWNNTAPTPSVFSLGTDNAGNYASIAYCWHSVTGYSKIGSYTGNLSGVSVTTGFNPSFVMIKRSDSTGNWFIYDSARSNGDTFDDFLHPNLSAAETTNNSTFEINATATGFNVVGAGDGQTNASGGTFIYMAFK